MTTPFKATTIAQIVRQDYRTAEVFKKWGLNYCCGGNLPLEAACRLRGLDPAAVESALAQVTHSARLAHTLAYDAWPLEFLVDYIVHVHHDYIRTAVPALRQALATFVAGHRKQYPYLAGVEAAFDELGGELLVHLQKEEEQLFPYLKQVSHTYRRREVYGPLFVRMLGRPLAEWTGQEHRRILSLLTALREAATHYAFPDKACTNHQVIYHRLKEFDADLVHHKHLENNILFPRSMDMEKELLQF